MTTLATSSGTITLPDDIPWTDEEGWSPVAQQIDVSLGGSQLVEVSVQQYGRPITLTGDANTGWIDGDTMDALRAAEIAQLDTPFTLTFADGRTFSVLFLGGRGQPAVTGTRIAIANTDGTIVGNVTPRTTTERSNSRFWVVVRMFQVG